MRTSLILTAVVLGGLGLAQPARAWHETAPGCYDQVADPDRVIASCNQGLNYNNLPFEERVKMTAARGMAWARAGQSGRRECFDCALKDLNAAIAMAPAWTQLYLIRAAIHSERKSFDLALADLDRARPGNEANPVWHNARCWSLGHLGRAWEAMPACDRAVQLAPGSGEVHHSRGWVLMQMGDQARAAAEFRQALQLGFANPRDAQMARQDLAQLESSAGTAAPAVPAYPTSLPERIRRVQQLLAELGYDPGYPDGVMGRRTRTAVEAFQRDNGLWASGEIDDALVRALEAEAGDDTGVAQDSPPVPPGPPPSYAQTPPPLPPAPPPAVTQSENARRCLDRAGVIEAVVGACIAARRAGELQEADTNRVAEAIMQDALARGDVGVLRRLTESVLRAGEDGAEVRLLRGLIAFAEGRLDAALADFDRGLSFNARHVGLLTARAETRRRAGRTYEADADERQAATLDPQAAQTTRVQISLLERLLRPAGPTPPPTSVAGATPAPPETPPSVTQAPPTPPPPSAPTIETAGRVETTTPGFGLSGKVEAGGRLQSLTLNGKPVKVAEDGRFEAQVPYAPLGKSTFKLVATDVLGRAATAEVTVERKPAETRAASLPPIDPMAFQGAQRPDALAIVIGIEEYANIPKARFAARDAAVFYDVVAEALGVRRDNVLLLQNEKASRITFKTDVRRFLTRVRPGKTDVFLFFSGHGLAARDGKRAFFLPYDVHPDAVDDTVIDRDELIVQAKERGARSITVFIDACYSGRSRDNEAILANAKLLGNRLEAVPPPPEVTIITSSRGSEISNALESAEHGAFSYFLMRGLAGEADENGDGKVTTGEAVAYVQRGIAAQGAGFGAQTPTLEGDGARVLVSR